MASKEQKKTALVVGAGVGGVTLAARLAKAGLDVTVVEKNDWTGGRCSLIHDNGYRFDRGPSLFLLPVLFREAFQDLGTTLEAEGVNLIKCEPNYNVWFDDGQCVELSSDLARMKIEVEKWEGKDGFERYLGFLRESHRHYETTVNDVMHNNFTSLFSLLRPKFLGNFIDLHPLESVWSRASRYFWTERLRRAFTFGSMYMGMSPFEAPGTYSLLQYTELAEGIWYPEGGFHKVVDAIVKVGQRLGVKYLLSTPISAIKLSSDGKSATGVTLESGKSIDADIVVCNADLVYAYNNLLPKSSYAKSLSKREGSCSSISFYWSLDCILPELHTHNVFLADSFRESFDSIFKDQTLPEEPSFYVNVPSRVDPTAAPKGKDAVVVLCPTGHLLEPGQGKGLNPQSTQDWDAIVSKARKAICETIRARTRADIASHIVKENLNTPQTWKDSLNLDKGSILGISHSFFNMLCFRPSTKHASIENLYFVGASTHPGTGVPVVVAGSKITGEQILDNLGISRPWSAHQSVPRNAPKSSNKLDKNEPWRSHMSILGWFLLCVTLRFLLLHWNWNI